MNPPTDSRRKGIEHPDESNHSTLEGEVHNEEMARQ